jgi:hypothetical protein
MGALGLTKKSMAVTDERRATCDKRMGLVVAVMEEAMLD